MNNDELEKRDDHRLVLADYIKAAAEAVDIERSVKDDIIEPSLRQRRFCSRRDFRQDRSCCVNDGQGQRDHRGRLVHKRER